MLGCLLLASSLSKISTKELICDEYIDVAVINEDQIHSENCTFSYIELDANETVNIAPVTVQELDYDNEMNHVDVTGVIENIRFENSRISKLPREIFVKFKNLKSLSCDGVNLKTLSKNDLKLATNLEVLSTHANYLKTLEKMLFINCKKLKTLDLSINEIEYVDRTAFYGLDQLTKLLLYDNRLKILAEDLFEDLISLEEINLSVNQLRIVDEKIFFNSPKLQYIYFNDNQLQNITNAVFAKMETIHFIDLSNNELTSLEFNISASGIYATNNRLLAIKIGSVGYLSFYKNQLTEIHFESSTTILSLNLSTNKLNSNDFAEFGKMSAVKSLDFSFNTLGALNVSTLLDMTNLQTLNLQSTNLSVIPYGLFTHQTNLDQLDLSYNRLNVFDITKLSPLKSLTALFIEGNGIRDIDYRNIKIFLPNLKVFGFSDNLWNCSYLSSMNSFIVSIDIEIYTLVQEKTKSNVNGIACTDNSIRDNEQTNYEDKSVSVNPIKHHQLVWGEDNKTKAISDKFEAILQHVNATSEKFATKVSLINELQMIKSAIASVKHDVYEIRREHLNDKLSAVKNVTINVTSSYETSKQQQLLENNITLLQKINDMEIRLKKIEKPKLENEKGNVGSIYNSTPTVSSTDVAMRVMITAIFIITCGFTFVYFMRLYAKRTSRSIIRRAHSEANTINEEIF